MPKFSDSFFIPGQVKGKARQKFRAIRAGLDKRGREKWIAAPYDDPDAGDAEWKAIVLAAMMERAPREPIDGPVAVVWSAAFERPKSHFINGNRERGTLKNDAPSLHAVKPDIDNVEKLLFDAATKAGMWTDDCRVCHASGVKGYARPGEPGDRGPGAWVEVRGL